MAGGAVHVWNEWALQILVLLSFSLQVFLFIFAGFRRRSASKVLWALLWLAYLGADSTATYTIGHLSIGSITQVHGLVPFWAPFLLLHLGGQDTITAYAIEDSRLWLRHLQTLVVQSLGAAYVIYKYISWKGSSKLVAAAVLMLMVGFAKYGERVWALKCANNDSMMKLTEISVEGQKHLVLFRSKVTSYTQDEFLESLINRHVMLGLFVNLFHHQRPPRPSWCGGDTSTERNNVRIWEVIENELSLIYDIMYTKDWVIHTWTGLLIRVSSLVAIIYSFLMFQQVDKDGYARVDIAITYILLVGAALMEIISGLRSIWTTWAVRFLCMNKFSCLFYTFYILGYLVVQELMRTCRRRCSWFCCVSSCLGKGKRRTIGKFNMLERWSWWQDRRPWEKTPEQEYLIEKLLLSVETSASLEKLLLKRICAVAQKHDGQEDVMNCLGQNQELPAFNTADFNTKIITWHIATDAILRTLDESSKSDTYVEPIKVLSDYMMFLLKEHPEMLPGSNHSVVLAEGLASLNLLGNELRAVRSKDDLESLFSGRAEKGSSNTGVQVAQDLLRKGWRSHRLLKVIFDLWVEMLCYAGSQCSSDSHARKLSNGREFLTLVWLLTRYIALLAQPRQEDEPPPSC